MLEGSVIANATDVVVPDAGTLPVPVHPVQTCWVPVPPGAGEVTDAMMDVPASNHLLVGVGAL